MSADQTSSEAVIARLGFTRDIERLRAEVSAWRAAASPLMQDALEWQFGAGAKYFRPLTVFACYLAVYHGTIPPELIRSAVGLEMLHNVSLIIDDIVDGSTHRRGIETLHHHFGLLHALMVSGYVVADAYRIVRHDPHDITLFAELLKRLGVAECHQWAVRRKVGGVLDWRDIAREDTGSMFEVCACLGTRSEEFRPFGQLLGTLYHGCDDVGDVRGSDALGGGGAQDLRDGILTLPAALALSDDHVATLFHREDLAADELTSLAAAFRARLPEAETYLDTIADEAREQALEIAPNPAPLLALVDQVRSLSSQ